MAALLSHGLLLLSAAALAGAAWRTASLGGARGLARVVGAATLAVAAAVTESLALGLVGAGGSPYALSGMAAVTWVAARLALPPPQLPASRELLCWWRDLDAPARVVVGALLGVAAATTAWWLRFPVLGFDGITYHLSEVVTWVQRGTPGSVEPIYVGLPVGNYPVTNEVALTWAVGISRSFVPISLWMTGMMMLLVAASWLGLRTLGTPRWLAGLAISAICLLPLTVRQMSGPNTDLPALTWLVSGAALVAAAKHRAALLPPALVALGLAVGTKTTTLPFALIVLMVAAVAHRAELRRLVRPLAIAGAVTVVTGGTWYLRNLFTHGSPFWPLVATPWGDPVPPLIERIDVSFAQRPRATLEGRLPLYLEEVAGGFLLLGGALLAPAWARRRTVVAASGAALGGMILWANAPFTGLGDHGLADLVLSTVRYLLPTICAAALALALSGRHGRRPALAAGLVLASATAWSIKSDVSYLGWPLSPSVRLVVLGALAGVISAVLATRVVARKEQVPLWLPAATLAAAAAVLAWAGSGYVERHGRTGEFDAKLVRWFAGQPSWRNGDRPVAVTPALISVLTGDRLEHRLDPIALDESCDQIASRAREGWLVVARAARTGIFPPLSAERCVAGAEPSFDDGAYQVFGPDGL